MPHIRLVLGPEWEGLYINGTSVKQGEIVRARELIDILRDNLGYDAEVIQHPNLTENDFEDRLRDFPVDTIPVSDRI